MVVLSILGYSGLSLPEDALEGWVPLLALGGRGVSAPVQPLAPFTLVGQVALG